MKPTGYHIIFSNEIKYNIFGYNGRGRVQKTAITKIEKKNKIKKLQLNTAKICINLGKFFVQPS